MTLILSKDQVRDIIEKNEILDYKFDLEFSIAWTAIGKKEVFTFHTLTPEMFLLMY